ncbi:MAG: AMP-binding protein, partial [Simkaniaceae bacterium]|nr:AMP-binding protein [Simkaniaceae bacterium]
IIEKILRCRYDVEVRGLEGIQGSSFHNEGGLLFLPNHPAEIDPILFFMLTHKKFGPRPLVAEHFYYLPGVSRFMKAVRALPIPHVESLGNKWKLQKIDRALDQVADGLQAGDNFVIYPAGHLKRTPHENIGGSSFIHNLLTKLPNTKVVLVRTTGLWGSSFSRAITGRVPDFWKGVARGITTLLKHGFIFTPKRKVIVEFSPAPSDFPIGQGRLDLNKYLENWYNNYPGENGRVSQEPVKLVTYTRKREDFIKVTAKPEAKEKKVINLSHDERVAIMEKLAEIAEMKPEDVHEDSELSTDLGLDSLDIAEVHAYLDTKFDVKDLALEDLVTVYDLFEAAHGHFGEVKEREAAKKTGWKEEKTRKGVVPPEGETIQEAFLRQVIRMGNASACGDHNTGVLSYKRMAIAVFALAKQIEKLPGKYIGILLPSSVGTYLLILATLFARKVPTVLNWTVGVRSLNHAKQTLNLQTVISSRRFLNKVDALDLGELEQSLVLVEVLKKRIRLPQKLAALMKVKMARGLIQTLRKVKGSRYAVVLFTSGTESYPKAVPLTHKNIIENQRSALAIVDFKSTDIMYGILPPFHSFGFTVTGLLPILSGIRVFYSPDPTDAHAMAHDCADWKISLFCCAPTFYRNLFRVAKRDDLQSVRLFITGAEKAGDDLFNAVSSLGNDSEMIEGYGISECSPMVSAVRPGSEKAGVGPPLPGIEIIMIDPETDEKAEKGEILISGPNVFPGYLGHNAPDPFIEIDGKKWYRSGDFGYLDKNGNLILSGRLKRFVKVGGEMVSLIALEEELLSIGKKQGWDPLPLEVPALCVMPLESDTAKTQLILFTTCKIDKEEVNKHLRESGFG